MTTKTQAENYDAGSLSYLPFGSQHYGNNYDSTVTTLPVESYAWCVGMGYVFYRTAGIAINNYAEWGYSWSREYQLYC